jgi:hypothetical protein
LAAGRRTCVMTTLVEGRGRLDRVTHLGLLVTSGAARCGTDMT